MILKWSDSSGPPRVARGNAAETDRKALVFLSSLTVEAETGAASCDDVRASDANATTGIRMRGGGTALEPDYVRSTSARLRSVPNNRFYLSANKSYPTAVMSVLKFSPTSSIQPGAARPRHVVSLPLSRDAVILPDAAWIKKRKGRSFACIVDSEWYEATRVDRGDLYDAPEPLQMYSSSLLDDPSIRQGRHRTVEAFSGTLVSVLPFIDSHSLKNELNHVFEEKHPKLSKELDLSLSKIRGLKKAWLNYCVDNEIELSTLTFAIVYFEKLVLTKVIVKENRKIAFGCCVLLASKFNDEPRRRISSVVSFIESSEGVSSDVVRRVEFALFVRLQFSLSASAPEERVEWTRVFHRLLAQTGSSEDVYLGKQVG